MSVWVPKMDFFDYIDGVVVLGAVEKRGTRLRSNNMILTKRAEIKIREERDALEVI